jgi:hypothetical protein
MLSYDQLAREDVPHLLVIAEAANLAETRCSARLVVPFDGPRPKAKVVAIYVWRRLSRLPARSGFRFPAILMPNVI